MADKKNTYAETKKKKRTASESEEMRRDRTYEEKFMGYYGGVDLNRYMCSEEDLEEMARELPVWDILPPGQQGK